MISFSAPRLSPSARDTARVALSGSVAVLYVATVLSLYLELAHTPLRISLPDQAVARRRQASGIPCEVVETALLLGSLRRFDRSPDASALPRILQNNSDDPTC